MEKRDSGPLAIFKHGIFLLGLGVVIGILGGVGFYNVIHKLSSEKAGINFINGFGLGVGASVGLVFMIWVLKTCDRYLAAFDSDIEKGNS